MIAKLKLDDLKEKMRRLGTISSDDPPSINAVEHWKILNELKEEIELRLLIYEKCRLLTHIINWIKDCEKNLNSIGKHYYSRMALDINVATSMGQLDKIEKDWDESQRRQPQFED
ncbi:MAG: hypothetical protein Q7K65_04890 [Candidatus Buchananbacteria bacterium]|nr:hypothetical protein [Candidatus Buchananbacteria bacterium]